jgi:hypothetical protein
MQIPVKTAVDKAGATVIGDFKKAERSNHLQNINCVEAAPNSLGGLTIRDTTAGPDAPVQHYTRDEVGAFLNGLLKGEFGDFSEFVPPVA